MYDQPAVIEALDEIWDKGRSQGQATVLPGQTRFLLIDGILQERSFDLKILPVLDSSGETIAFYKSLSDVTAQVFRERRDSCVRRFCGLNTQLTNTEELYSKIMHILNDMSMYSVSILG
jgi:hypothetical protein